MDSGFKAIYENAKYDYILFLENDFEIDKNINVDDFINNSIHFLNSGIDVVRARSRKNAGYPNYALNLKYNVPERYLSETIYWLEDPETVYPVISRITPKIGDDKWYVSSSAYCNYTNNPCIYRKSFFKENILPYCKFNSNIENELTNIWASKHYRCVYGEGLFTHRRIDGHDFNEKY